MYRLHTHCRACGLGKPDISTLKFSVAAGNQEVPQKLMEVLDLGLMPLANDFCSQDQERAGYAPLKLLWCPRCTLGQLSVVVNPEIIYRNHYPYVTSPSKTMKDHFASLVSDLKAECETDLVVEIGSNDGTLLEFMQQNGFSKTYGVEPAENLANAALKRGINTVNDFFSAEVAQDIERVAGLPDLIIARHVFCHIDDWTHAIAAIDQLCGKETVVAIEVPYFIDTVKNGEWDQIYHEHLSYMTVKAMQAALKGSHLHVSKVLRYPIHGGAIVMILRRDDSEFAKTPLPVEYLDKSDLNTFAARALDRIAVLKKTVNELIEAGNTVVGYGASAKATQWIQSCGFTRKHIKWICDTTMFKQYKCAPGSDIPIVDEGALTRELPDYAVCFAWNFMSEIVAKEKIFKAHGGRWINPNADIEVAPRG